MSEYQRLFKNTLWIAMGSLSSKLIVFVMVPVYTFVLSRNEYGLIDFFQNSAYFLGALFSLQVAEGVFRFCNDADKQQEQTVFTNALFMTLLMTLLLLLSSPLLSMLNLYEGHFISYVTLVSLYMLLELLKAFCRAKAMMKTLAISDLIYTAIFAALNYCLLVILHMGISGFLLSLIAAQAVSTIFLAITTKAYTAVKPSSIQLTVCKSLLQYSLPLVPAAVSLLLINYVDRYLLIGMLSISAAGLYTVSCKIPTALIMLNKIFNQSWSVSALKQFDDLTISRADKEYFYSQIFRSKANAMIILVSLSLVSLRFSFETMIGKNFYEAWVYTPPLLIAALLYAMSNFLFMIFIGAKKTKVLFTINALGAITNIVSNLILIAQVGIQGASISTLLGFLTVFTVALTLSRKHIRVKLHQDTVISFIVLVFQTMAIYQSETIAFYMQLAAFSTILIINIPLLKSLSGKLLQFKRQRQNVPV